MRWTERTPPLPVQPLARLLAGRGAAEALLLAARLADEAPLVLATAALRARVLAHLGEKAVEQGGLLVGDLYARRPAETGEAVELIHISRAVPSADPGATGISLRMEAAVWSRAGQVLGPHQRVVGWYHSHPGLGAFFSATDRRTQEAFFAHPWSVGWVIDPVLGGEKWFLGADAEELGDGRVITG
ncbi:MAG: Mov34/MPN/PAD-1 family protein [Betaproteobacteria bacterium]|nr:Mov34/MPN/PAD-1 family protein [Betaproteobacteria bacterium]